MIELRWLVTSRGIEGDSLKLQYRTIVNVRDEHGVTYEKWSEWQTVPEVRA